MGQFHLPTCGFVAVVQDGAKERRRCMGFGHQYPHRSRTPDIRRFEQCYRRPRLVHQNCPRHSRETLADAHRKAQRIGINDQRTGLERIFMGGGGILISQYIILERDGFVVLMSNESAHRFLRISKNQSHKTALNPRYYETHFRIISSRTISKLL